MEGTRIDREGREDGGIRLRGVGSNQIGGSLVKFDGFISNHIILGKGCLNRVDGVG